MIILCDRCIKGMRNRGQTVIVVRSVEENSTETCFWCEKSETELYTVMLNHFESEGEYNF